MFYFFYKNVSRKYFVELYQEKNLETMSIHSKPNNNNGNFIDKKIILFQDVINVNEHRIHREELFVQHDEQS